VIIPAITKTAARRGRAKFGTTKLGRESLGRENLGRETERRGAAFFGGFIAGRGGTG
jgi:hypothetical protein